MTFALRLARPFAWLSILGIAISLSAQEAPPAAASEILARATSASVLILTGEGAGRLQATASGIMIRNDGVLLTAYHVIKDAREVQVRLKNGDVFDQVELLGFDVRRDVAALKISGRNFPTLPIGSAETTKVGDAVYAITASGGLTWSATQGIFSALRPAEEVPGAGNGYRLAQFTAPMAPGASGGALLGPGGSVIGIITGGNHQGAAFAVPIESVLGLADQLQHTALGSGSALNLPRHDDPPSSSSVTSAQPIAILKAAKTAVVISRSAFFTADTLNRALVKEKDFGPLHIVLVQDRRVADLVIEIDRPLFTYHFTYSVIDSRTTIVLFTGRLTAFDGDSAAGPIAKALVKEFVNVRKSSTPSPAQ